MLHAVAQLLAPQSGFKPRRANVLTVRFGQDQRDQFQRTTLPKHLKARADEALDFLRELEKHRIATGQMTEAERYSPTSPLNLLYQQLFPRDRGVIVYGSSRTPEGSAEFKYAEAVGRAIAKLSLDGRNFFVVDGGGPGAMRAVGKGAFEAGGHAMGSAMNFIGEVPSTDVHPEFVIHPDFSERIDAVGGYEHRGAYTGVVPGGPGTEQEIWKKANELFYDQTRYPSQKQIVLFDFENFFTAKGGFLDHLDYLIQRGKANPKMRNLFVVAKEPEDGVKLFLNQAIPWTPGTIKEVEGSKIA